MALKFPYYETEAGLLVKMDRGAECRRINDKPLTETFNPEWWLVEDEASLRSVSVHVGTRHTNRRYVLVNDSVPGLEKVIDHDSVERDAEGRWSGRHHGLDALYEYAYDLEDLGYKPEEYEAELLGKLDFERLGDPTGFSYKLHKEKWAEQDDALGYKDIFDRYSWSKGNISVDEIAKAFAPEVAWHLYPCSVDSGVAYRIIRSHVKDHIDGRYAVVTSDYDFCFTVKKKIRIVPFVKEWEIRKDNGRSYRPPRFKRQEADHVLHEIFEMTPAKDNYRGYTVVDGFKGESLEDLARAIDRYLKELMEVINAPLARCPKCDGMGALDFCKLPTNEREPYKVRAA